MRSFFGGKSSPKPEAADARASAPPAGDAPVSDARETGVVLDALGATLQILEQNTFDTDVHTAEDLRKLLHAWMLHATMGAPRPGVPEDKRFTGVFYRDWKGLSHFLSEARREEKRYVSRAIEDLRTVVWAFVAATHQAVLEGNEEDRIASEQLGRMRSAVEGSSIDTIKREALSVVSVMEQLIAHRKERQRQQFAVLAEKIKHLGRELEEARRESTTDPLTGLPNRKAFDDYVSRCIELHSLMAQPASLFVIDVDHFKQINDTLGHPVGDLALQRVATVIASTFVRRVDFTCRYGGDEFAVILQETDARTAHQLGDRLRQHLREAHEQEVQAIEAARAAGESPADPLPPLTLSIGIAELVIGDDALAWLKRADGALYEAKRAGRDSVASIGAQGPTTPAR